MGRGPPPRTEDAHACPPAAPRRRGRCRHLARSPHRPVAPGDTSPAPALPVPRRAVRRLRPRRHDRLTDGQWAGLEPLLPKGTRVGRPPIWHRRQLIDGIRFRVRTGVPSWRPVDLPSWNRTRRQPSSSCRAQGRCGNPGRAVERLDAPLRRLAVRAAPFRRLLTGTERRRVQEMVCRPGGCVSPFGLDRQLIIGGRSMSTCRRPLGDPPER
ncbi:transposase [Streptomyces sp. NPDC051310]|uniref:transposase n=1 Tax=Streptomyces sp. NPDC051310 TaxID=3365649 RepID=UPI00378E573E